jgi:hypothetical protein
MIGRQKRWISLVQNSRRPRVIGGLVPIAEQFHPRRRHIDLDQLPELETRGGEALAQSLGGFANGR